MMGRTVIDLAGKRFGKLVVISRSTNAGKSPRWLCKCDCGKEVVRYGSSLTCGDSYSCGCIKGKAASIRNRTHGKGHSRLWYVWEHMKQRCYNPNYSRYKDWGGRGITVCEEWKNDFTAFEKWAIENGYDETAKRGACTIDRINVDGNYEPSNCRWADAKTQAQNRRKKLR